jgi:carbon-monoxide dehydrogenase medium subunit
VKPAPFAYEAPGTLDAALGLLTTHGDEAKVLAGGQSLIPVMNFRLARPAVLIDLNRLSDLDFVRRHQSGALRIGAMTRQSRIEREPLVTELAPLLAEAVPHIAHPQIRNRGTVGGTLAHADPAAEMPAVVVALDARLRLAGPDSSRWVDAADFFRGLFTTALAPDELLVEVEIPAPPLRAGSAFLEIARRHGDYALAGVAVTVTLDESGACGGVDLVALSVGDQPALSTSAPSVLAGQRPDAALFEAAAAAIQEEIEPLGDIHASADFKRHLSGVLTRRALAKAFERAATEPLDRCPLRSHGTPSK